LCEITIYNDGTIAKLIKSFKNLVLLPFSLPINTKISPSSKIGINCRISNCVNIEDNVIIEDGVIIGHSPPSKKSSKTGKEDLTFKGYSTTIKSGSIVRSGTVIYQGVTLDEKVDCAHHVVIREYSFIGSKSYITPFTVIKSNVKTGENCRLGGIIADRCVLEDNVTSLGLLIHKYKPRHGGFVEPAPLLCSNVVVGRGAVIIGGVKVGSGAFVGAGAIITKDILAGETVVMTGKLRQLEDIHDV
jgi:UDP-3-O-[3-hydroxymyristoyl] glucosamine N-acyltransferase